MTQSWPGNWLHQIPFRYRSAGLLLMTQTAKDISSFYSQNQVCRKANIWLHSTNSGNHTTTTCFSVYSENPLCSTAMTDVTFCNMASVGKRKKKKSLSQTKCYTLELYVDDFLVNFIISFSVKSTERKRWPWCERSTRSMWKIKPIYSYFCSLFHPPVWKGERERESERERERCMNRSVDIIKVKLIVFI